MTVLQVVPELETGGVERTTLEVAQALTAAGNKALVFSQGGRMLAELTKFGGQHIYGPAKSKSPWTVFVSNPLRLAKLIKTHNVTIIHARSRAPAWSALLAARLTGIPFVTTYHGIYNAKSPLKRWYNSIMARGDLVIANSIYTRDHLIGQHQIAPAKVEVVYRGVDIEAFDSAKVSPERLEALAAKWGIKLQTNCRRIILPARLTAWKGQRVLIDALALLKAKGIDFEALLVGDAQGRQDYLDSLKESLAGYGIDEQVKLVGHCSDMPAAFMLADIAVTPSTEPEAFGRTAAEAQAMGLPVIASDLGGARETVEHAKSGYLVRPSNPEALAFFLESLISATGPQRKKMGQIGKQRVRELFTTKALQNATLAIYQRLAGEKS